MGIIYLILLLIVMCIVMGYVSLSKDDIHESNSYIDRNIEESMTDIDHNAMEQDRRAYKMIKQEISHKIDEQLQIDDKTKQCSPVSNDLPNAPLLENFEDYAPLEIDWNKAIQQNKNTIKVKQQPNDKPQAMNDHELNHCSKFESEYRVPWSGQMSNQDLSLYFEPNMRKKMDDPTVWEQNKTV